MKVYNSDSDVLTERADGWVNEAWMYGLVWLVRSVGVSTVWQALKIGLLFQKSM